VADGVKPPRANAPGENIKPLDSEGCSAFLQALVLRSSKAVHISL
jgi:hypothetical protein